MKRILVIRFSSMGDVLLTAPVLSGLISKNVDTEIYLLTKKQFAGYFDSVEGLKIIEADTEGLHKGFKGLLALSRHIKEDIRPDVIVDLHSVPRSWVLTFASGPGIPVFRIDKGRKEKRAYIRDNSTKALKHTVDRYIEAFDMAGLDAGVNNYPFIQKESGRKLKKGERVNIGIAPFARHRAKTWPIVYTLELMRLLSMEFEAIFHFYGGRDEFTLLSQADFGELKVINHAGQLSPGEEINSISNLDFFISMDSGNMHLSDLVGTRVYSIWGATHPDLGFRPLNQPPGHIIETDEALECRPCSVYGNKECKLKENKYRCLLNISPEKAAEKILNSIFT